MVAQRQQPIVINVMVGEDRRLIVDLPPDTPTGSFTMMLAPSEYVAPVKESVDTIVNPERERLRAILLAAGKLGTAHHIEHVVYPKDEEWMNAGWITAGTLSSEEILRELRSDE